MTALPAHAAPPETTLPPVPPAGGRVPGPRTWTLELPAGLKLLTLNQRLHWAERGRRGKAIRQAAWVLARQARIPLMDRVVVTAEYQPPDRRKRDGDNLALSVKYAIDGATAAGMVPEDDSSHVLYGGCRIGERYPLGRLVIMITEAA